MAKLVKLMRVRDWSDPQKDKEIYANPEFVQFISCDDSMKIVELTMQGTILRIRGELDEIAEKLSYHNKRIY